MADFETISAVNDFEYGQSIRCSNPDYLIRYERELKARKLNYRIVQGFGFAGLDIVICRPEEFKKYRSKLLDEIVVDVQVLDRRWAGFIKRKEL